MVAMEILGGMAMAGPTYGGVWAWIITIAMFATPVWLVTFAILDVILTSREFAKIRTSIRKGG